jgi:low temperature requirement protein LtrA
VPLLPDGQRIDVLRSRDEGTEVTALELFFDLVYVFAITQLSHLLLAHLTWRGALETLLMTLAVWWAWIDTSWISNWFDPIKMPVRLMFIALMLLSLLMSAAIPEAFGDRALWFAIAYVTTQIGRSAFCWYSVGNRPQRDGLLRITVWAILSAPLWIAGALVDGDARLYLWIAAAAMDTVAPALGYYTPGLGKSETSDWEISAEHMAERCQLFVIICLGESVLLTGATLSDTKVTFPVAVGFIAAFAISVAMWWIYFRRASRAAEIFSNDDDPGRLGRIYTYFHLPMIAGIITLAVANEKVIAHPSGHVEPQFTAVVIGGALLYMGGNALFNSALTESIPWRRLVAMAALIVLIPLAHFFTPVTLMLAVLAVFVWIAFTDHRTIPPLHGESGEEEVQFGTA